MSKADELIRIKHMLDAANQILRFTKDLDEKRFAADEAISLAVTRLLEIIGEASRYISAETRSKYPDVPWQQLGGIRNRLIHAYINVDLAIVWNICQDALPRLIADLQKIIDAANT
ncbi:MAG: DUF86 domain-containing protein [Candidatus Zixiibacteriota bacterium]